MARIGTKRNTKKPNPSVYLKNVALEAVIEGFADAMRTAFVPYIATTGRFTLRMEAAWDIYVDTCQKINRSF